LSHDLCEDFAMRLLFALGVVLSIVAGSLAEDEIKPIELTIRARAIETPVLKYRLLPAESEIKPGNAAPILLRLPWEQMPWMTEVFPTLLDWESRPLDAPEWTTSGGVLPENFYNEMKRAAFRRDASWEYPIGETPSPYLILLPDVQGMRAFLAGGLSARIRYHLSRGELEAAREGIVVGLANARHLARTPFFVNQLVALALHRRMLERVDELISQPKSHNLYWALSSLPDSLVEMDRTASFESDIFALTFPAVNDLDRHRDAKEWSKMARQLVEFLEQMGEIPRHGRLEGEESIVEQLLQQLMPDEKTHLANLVGQARADLPRMLGISKEKVATMSDDEAGVRWYAHMRIARDHLTAAVLVLRPREAWPELRKLQDQIRQMQEKTLTKGFDFFNPTSIYVSIWSLKRKIGMLRIVEAVRDHLATHEGLPASLDEIKHVVVPVDPLTDQPFVWTVNGNTAMLTAPPLPADLVAAGSAETAASVIEYRLEAK
jgi:hypothetical protein